MGRGQANKTPLPSDNILYGTLKRTAKPKNSELVLDQEKQMFHYEGKIISLNNESRGGREMADIIRIIGEKQGAALTVAEIGEAVYGIEWGRLYGQPTLNGFLFALNNIFRQFQKSAIVNSVGDKGNEYRLADGVQFRTGSIERGKVVS